MGDRYVQEARAGGNASVREGRAQGEGKNLCAVHCAPCAGSPRAAQLSSSAGIRLLNSRDIAPHTHNPTL